MKILFVCRSFNNMAGGVERMAIMLMNEMVNRKYNVTLFTWDKENTKNAFYKIDNQIDWHVMDIQNHLKKANWLTRIKRAFKVRKIVERIKPDIILAFQHGAFLSFKFFLFGFKIPIIAAERNAISRLNHTKSGTRRNFILQTFRLADKITVQLPSYIKDYPKFLHHKMICIENPVLPATNFAKPAENTKNKILLCIGRLAYQKNQYALIKAFSLIYQDFPDWQLMLAGDGEDRIQLEAEVEKLKLTKQVIFKGNVKNTSSLYCQAHLFVLPSKWEGFPNVIAEAMSHGLPCIGYKDCDGTNILIQHEYNGLLAEQNGSPETLAYCLKELMLSPEKRKRFSINAIKSMKQYKPEKIFDKWENLLKEYM